MSLRYTGPIPKPAQNPARGWAGYSESLLGLALGRVGVLACGAGFVAPEIMGAVAFREVARLATVPLVVLFGFLAQAMARIAWEQRRSGDHSPQTRHEVLLAIPGFAAAVALAAVLTHVGTVHAEMDSTAARHLAAWSGRVAGAATVAAFAMVPQLPRVVAAWVGGKGGGGEHAGLERRRMAARLVDSVAVCAVTVLAVALTALATDPSSATSGASMLAATIVTMFLYETGSGRSGRSLGKRCCGLHVRRSTAPNGGIGWSAAALRGGVLAAWWGAMWLVIALESGGVAVPTSGRAITMFLAMSLTGAPLVHAAGQGIHDVVAGTVVLDVTQPRGERAGATMTTAAQPPSGTAG